MISAQHVPGKLNTIADRESRVFNDTSDWKIDPRIISPFLKGCKINLFASHLTAQLSKYVSWRLDPEALHSDALTMNWAPLKGYAFPPFNLISAVLNKVTQDREDIILVAPNWQPQPWWPLLLSLMVEQPVLIPITRHLLKDPAVHQRIHPMFPQTTLSRMSHIRGQYQAMGISENVTEILLSASRPSTRRTYKSAWGRWSRWCDKRKVDPFSAPIADILHYLTEYFNGGAAYHSVNVTHSAISTTHAKLDGLPVGQHPLVTQLLKGMFNNRPPRPRYSHTWDVASVTKYLASLGNNRSLSLKQLSFKLAMLFFLTCPERVSALTKLDLRHCHVLPEGVEFTLSAPRKGGSTDQLPKAFFARFPSKSKLCPVESLRSYLKATCTIRATIPSSKVDPLFISYVKPHKPITAMSLGRWLHTLLKDSGLNTSIFKPHSVRGASTTAAANSSVPLSEILRMADWSSSSTFEKFYYKPVYSSEFAHAVLR